jgi:hypothetical protein
MIRKIIGTTLVIVGVVVAVLLLTYGGPILPHIIGPITGMVVGVALLAYKGKAK